MDDSQSGKVEPNRKCFEPPDGTMMLVRSLTKLCEKDSVLSLMRFGVLSQIISAAIRRNPPDRVELMVSEHGARRPPVAHRTDDTQHFTLIRTAIDEIADEQHCSFGMRERAIRLGISKHPE